MKKVNNILLKIKNILIKIYNSVYFPFLVLFLIQLGINYFKTIGYGDDDWFRNILSNKQIVPSGTVTEYLKWRYETWTSRIIIEFFLVNLLQLNVIIWKVLDATILAILGIAISKVFVSKELDNKICQKINWAITILLMCLSFDMFGGAGWIATFANYLLPITMGIVTLIPLKKVLCEDKIRKFEYPIYMISCLIASNMEQMCAILFVVFLIFTIYCFAIKKKNVILPLLFIIVLLGLINIITCPGNDARNEAEMKNYYPKFEELVFIDKIALGLSGMMQFCLINFNLIYVLLTGLIMFIIINKYENPIIKLIAIFPFVMGVAFNVCINFTASIAPKFIYSFKDYPVENVLTQNGNAGYMILSIYMAIILCIFISLILIFRKQYRTILAILILGAGMCAKIMLGFSPTVWASGDRTGFILMISMILVIILILEEQNEKMIDNFLNIIIACGIFSFFEKGMRSFSIK